MEPRIILRIEGLTVLTLALGGYFTLNGSIWLLLGLALAPDLSMLGYLAGTRVGSWSYNTIHTYTLPLTLGAVGFWGDVRLALLIALVWIGHIGVDRMIGYGLKYESGFKDTHLSSQPVPVAAFADSEE